MTEEHCMRGLEIRLLTDIGIREGAGSELLSLLRERESGKKNVG